MFDKGHKTRLQYLLVPQGERMDGTLRTSINISKQQFPSGLMTQNTSCKVTIQSDKSHRQTDGEKSDIYSSYRFLLYYLSKTVHSPSVPLRYLRLKANLKEKQNK